MAERLRGIVTFGCGQLPVYAEKGLNQIPQVMFMKKIIVVLLVGAMVSLVSGCATYTHQSRDADRWDNDYAMCVTKADYQVDFHPYTTDVAHLDDTKLMTYSDRYWGIIRGCMEAKGYVYEEETTWFDTMKKAVQYN